MKYLLSIATLFLLLTACTKNRQITITGRLMQSCDVPAANKEALIHIDGGGITAKPIVELPFTTDENGYFEVHHDEAFSKFSMRTSAAHSVLEASIGEDNKALGEVYVFPPSASYYLRLDVHNNSYTNQDTLTYYDWGYPQNGADHWVKRVAGPFSDGIIDTVSFVQNINGLPIVYESVQPPRLRIDYGIKSWNDNFVYVYTPHCQDEYQTVTLVIE